MDRARLSLTVLVVAGSCVAFAAEERRAHFTVSAHVEAVAVVEQLGALPEIDIGPADLQRGFIDVPEQVHLRIFSNSSHGFALDVHSLSPLIRSINVEGLGPSVSLPADGGSVVQRWQQAQTVSLALKFRLLLGSTAKPGRYAWPLQLRVHPLEAN